MPAVALQDERETGERWGTMLAEREIRELVVAHGTAVNRGRPIRKLIEDGELPRLSGCTVFEGKVSDSEHGVNAEGRIVAADELYTLDSSRFWRTDDGGGLLTRDGTPISFSKEFARGMVKDKDQQFTEEQANEIAVRYIQGLQHLTGAPFTPDLRPHDERIVDSTNLILDALL